MFSPSDRPLIASGLYRISGVTSHVATLLAAAQAGTGVAVLHRHEWSPHAVCNAAKRFLASIPVPDRTLPDNRTPRCHSP